MALTTGSLLTDLLSILTTCVVLIYAYFKWSYQYWKRRNVPYLEPSIPFGNFLSPYGKESLGVTSKRLYKVAKAKEWDQCGLYGMATPIYMPLDLELLKLIMTKDFATFTDRGLYTNERDDPLSCHLFSLGGIKWRNLRMKLTPTFTSGKMKAMFSTLVDCGLLLEKYLEQHFNADKGTDIKDTLSRFSTEIIGSCAFGINCNTFDDPDCLFRVFGEKALKRTKLEVLKLSFCINFPDLARALRLRFTPTDVSEFFTKVVEDTVAYREKNNVTRKDFLQLLIDMKDNNPDQNPEMKGTGNTLTMEEMVAQCFIFFIAGFETSSTTMTFALYELCQHQDIQDKVRDEMNIILAKHNNQITYDSLSELTYTKQVIDETLRKYPPVPFVNRLSVADYKVPGKNVILEKGTRVLIPIYGIHYDEEYYPDPEVFDPDRFSEENKKNRHQYVHIPFGEGPRICIGERFGIMQTKVGLTTLLRKYKVTLNERTEVPLEMSTKEFILTSEGGVWINMEKI